jgi:integrase
VKFLEEDNEQTRVLTAEEEKLLLKVNNAHTATVKRPGVDPSRLYYLHHTWAATAGVDLVTLAAMLGHSRIQMVLRYAHPTEEHQLRAMKKAQTFVAKRAQK